MRQNRAVLLALLVLGGSLLVANPGHAQSSPDTGYMHDVVDYAKMEAGQQNWTASPPNQQTAWRYQTNTNGGTDPGWRVSRQVAGVAAGYDANVDLNVTSPVFSLAGKRLLQVLFDAQGSSDANDKLRVLIQDVNGTKDPAGNAEWNLLVELSGVGPEYGSEMKQARYSDSRLAAYDGKDIRLRLRFTSDATRDSGEVTQGWFVDHMRLRGVNQTQIVDPDAGRDPTTPKNYVDFVICRTAETRAAEGDDLALDLIVDQGKYIKFVVEYNVCQSSYPTTPYLVGVQLSHSGKEKVNLILKYVPKDNQFVGELPVNFPEFVVGRWNVTIYAFAEDGTQGPGQPLNYPLIHRNITATASASTRDVDVWLVGHENEERAPKQRMGPGSQLRFVVDSESNWPQVQKITYQIHIIEGSPKKLRAGPELPLVPPYVIDSGILGTEGEQVLFIRGYDRANPTFSNDNLAVDEGASAPGATVSVHRNVTLTRVPLIVDNSAPEVSIWVGNATLHEDVPFEIAVNITEPHSPDYTLRLLLDGDVLADVSGRNPGANHTFTATTNKTGMRVITASVSNSVNMSTLQTLNVTILPQFADTTVTHLRLAHQLARRELLVGNEISVDVNVTQRAGFGAVPMHLRITGPDLSVKQDFDVAANATKIQSSPYVLTQAGPIRLRANATAFEPVFELTPADQESVLDFEVFLGRVDVGQKSYLIRANARGQPVLAVDDLNDATFDLTLEDVRANPPCNGAVYTFMVASDLFCWNPLLRDALSHPVGITTLDGPVIRLDAVTDQDSPAPVLLALLAALAAAVAVARRRQ